MWSTLALGKRATVRVPGVDTSGVNRTTCGAASRCAILGPDRARVNVRRAGRAGAGGLAGTSGRRERVHRRGAGRRALRLLRLAPYNPRCRVPAAPAEGCNPFVADVPCQVLQFTAWVSQLSLQIVHYPHPALRHLSRPLKRVDAELRTFVEQMFELMYEHEGVGLAANQVDLPYRVFITNVEGDRDAQETECVYVNPVLSAGHGQAEAEEGCLSIPGVYAPVVRKATIKVEAFDLAGNEIVRELNGLEARVVQHETDHLDGTLFIDRLGPTQAAAVRDQLEEFELVFRSQRETGEMPSDEMIAGRLSELERLRT